MTRYDRRCWILAVGLASLAGYVDAIGFLKLGGLFVSFMSGNSTRLAVSLATGTQVWTVAAVLLVSFIVGVMVGTYLAAKSGRLRKPAPLLLVFLLLACAGMAQALSYDRLVVLLLAAGMGAENSVFQRDGEVSIGLTYMTGTLVKLGQHATAALMGGPRLDWLPYFLLWSGLIGGAVSGARLYTLLGQPGLYIAPTLALLLTFYSLYLVPISSKQYSQG